MASSLAIIETREGVSLPTAHLPESYCGQTFEVCHHQNNTTTFVSIFTAPTL